MKAKLFIKKTKDNQILNLYKRYANVYAKKYPRNVSESNKWGFGQQDMRNLYKYQWNVYKSYERGLHKYLYEHFINCIYKLVNENFNIKIFL